VGHKKGKLPPLKTDALAMRSVAIQSSTADSVKRSVRVVTATETPIDRWDGSRQMVVAEVLEMDGMQMRPGATQLPIVDSHDTSTVRNVLGSLRNITIEGDEFGGIAYFASDDESQRAYTKLMEGHITDFSITAQPNEVLELKTGQRYTTSRGTEVVGPANVITNWTALDASLVATGADSRSTVRRSYTDLKQRKRTVDAALLEQLKAMGLPDGMEDPNQVLAWVVGKLGAPAETVESMEEENPVDEVVEQMEGEEEVIEQMDDEENPVVEATARKAIEGKIKRALAVDQKRRNEIQATCKLAKVERAFADELCDAGVSVEVAKQRIIEKMATQPLGRSVEADVRVTRASEDKFIAAASDGLIARAQGRTSIKRNLYSGEKPAEGYEDFKSLNLIRTATLFAERAGLPVQRMNNIEISRAVMRMSTLQGFMDVSQRYRIERSDFSAYHTTGSFANLLLDASNKTLLGGYEEAPYTWNLWARQATSVDDMKNINRTRFSEAPNPEEVPEGADYPEKAMSDSKETYSVSKYGESFSVSWETIINDDLDALSRIPAMHGNAMRRFQNKKVYEVLTSNPVMGDGKTLFASDHASGSNISGAAAAPSVDTLNAMFVKMMTQKGLTSDAIINVIPRFVIVPVAYSATLLRLIASIADPTAGGSAVGNANTLNIYGPNGMRPITPVIEPQLDASSATDWYGAADNSQIDTVELTFLSGEESPVVENEYNMKNDTYFNKIRQTFGVKAIDWRGLYRNKA
jgi:hypothetical protein